MSNQVPTPGAISHILQLGGNKPFRDFMRNYAPADQGGYNDNLSPYDTYHCWAATQYREKVQHSLSYTFALLIFLGKLDAALAGKEWTQSAPSASANLANRSSSPGRPSSAQGLRKSRASTRSGTGSALHRDSASPSSFRGSPRDSPDPSLDQKTLNESYFANLGRANESRPADLPPSQGGKYQGFGSTPTPPMSNHPSYGLSSSAAPSLSELQENPMAALSKGWSLFSAAVVGASKAVSENVIQPGVEKVTDPNFQASVRGYMTEAQKKAAAAGGSANQWSKQQFGVDVAESVGGVVGAVKDRVVGPSRPGYGAIATENDSETSGLYHDGDDDDFFGEFTHGRNESGISPIQATPATAQAKAKAAAPATKKNNWDDDWKDF